MVCALTVPLALMWLDATAETIGFTSVMPDFFLQRASSTTLPTMAPTMPTGCMVAIATT